VVGKYDGLLLRSAVGEIVGPSVIGCFEGEYVGAGSDTGWREGSAVLGSKVGCLDGAEDGGGVG